MKYHVTYSTEFHPEGLERTELPEGKGACTAILIGSLLYPEDGSYGVAFVGADGRTGGDLASAEIWKAWFMLAKQLADDPELSASKRELCKMVFDIVCDAMREPGRSSAE